MADFTDHPLYDTLMAATINLVNDVIDAQTLYFAANGKYFQGIKTPAIQLDGTTLGILDVDVSPSDQLESWLDFDSNTFKKNSTIPYQIKIDVYESSSGWGWVLTCELWYDNVGPDAYGNYGNHWVYKHHNGLGVLGIIEDEWYIQLYDVGGGL